jgi:hypothetical protein
MSSTTLSPIEVPTAKAPAKGAGGFRLALVPLL